MSYIRANSKYKYVEGTSKDYVFPASDEKGNKYVEDYGKLSKEGLCEILCRMIDRQYEHQFEKKYFMQQLANKLGVKLRDERLVG